MITTTLLRYYGGRTYRVSNGHTTRTYRVSKPHLSREYVTAGNLENPHDKPFSRIGHIANKY